MDPAIAGATVAALPVLAALATVAGAAGRRKRKKARDQMAQVDAVGSQKDAALLQALGYDPTKHRLRPSSGNIKGLRVVDDDMNTLAFFTRKQLTHPRVRKAWAKAMRETKVVVQR